MKLDQPYEKRTLIIVLNWNKPEQTKECLDSIMQINGCYDVLVVDNGSKEAKIEKLIKLIRDEYNPVIVDKDSETAPYPIINTNVKNIFIMLIGYNSGYATGNNYGLRFSHKSGYKFSLISNNDVEVPDKNILINLEKSLDMDDRYAWTAPKIVNVSGKLDGPSSMVSISELFFEKGIFFPYWFIFLRGAERIEKNKWLALFDNKNEIPYIFCGCFGLYRNSALEDVGYFDEYTFLYSEEEIISERFRKKNYLLTYTNDSEVIHKHYYRKEGINFRLELTFLRSRIYYLREYRGYGRSLLFLGAVSRISWLILYKPAIVIVKNIVGYRYL